MESIAFHIFFPLPSAHKNTLFQRKMPKSKHIPFDIPPPISYTYLNKSIFNKQIHRADTTHSHLTAVYIRRGKSNES